MTTRHERTPPKLGVVGGSDDLPAYPTDALPSALPLVLDDICFKAGVQTLLKHVTLQLEDVPVTAILGPNGAGKTLLLRVCHGLLKQSQGTMSWRDPTLARHPSGQSMVFQRPVMLRRTVEQNILYAMKVCRIPRDQQRARLQSSLEISGLNRHARRSAMRLSGGEQQRLALARCVAIRPGVLFLDEPTAHLDPTATRQVEQMMVSLRDGGTRLVMVTHDIGQARRLGDRVLFMHRGRVLENCAASRFFEEPGTAEGVAFLQGDLLW